MKKITDFKEEYFNIYTEINKNEKYKELSQSVHHGISRKDHINRVAALSFVMSKLFKADTISTTRGALLHDFFTDSDAENYSRKQSFKIHPYLALNNSMNYFDLNDKEKNIIGSHMFPVNFEKPKYLESFIVGAADKAVAIYEFLRFNLKVYTYFIVLFITTR